MKRLAWGLIFLMTAALGAAELNEKDPNTWTAYGKNSYGWRYSDLRQINASNVAQLVPKWIFQSDVSGKFEASPLVYDRLMYVPAPSNHAFALDLLTGRVAWHYYKKLPRGVDICCGQVNRGFAAIGGGLVFAGDREGYFVALDAKTGKVVWKFQTGGSVSAPPVSYMLDGKQYIAVAAGASMMTFALPVASGH